MKLSDDSVRERNCANNLQRINLMEFKYYYIKTEFDVRSMSSRFPIPCVWMFLILRSRLNLKNHLRTIS